MKHYTKDEWDKEQYKGQWSDSPWNRSRVDAGEIPAEYIGRRTVLSFEPGVGTVLLTEGVHFTVDDHLMTLDEKLNDAQKRCARGADEGLKDVEKEIC